MNIQEMFAYMQKLRAFVETKGEKRFQEEVNFEEDEFKNFFWYNKSTVQ